MIVEAVETLDGWYSLHLTYQMDWAAWNQVAQPKTSGCSGINRIVD